MDAYAHAVDAYAVEGDDLGRRMHMAPGAYAYAHAYAPHTYAHLDGRMHMRIAIIILRGVEQAGLGLEQPLGEDL